MYTRRVQLELTLTSTDCAWKVTLASQLQSAPVKKQYLRNYNSFVTKFVALHRRIKAMHAANFITIFGII